MSTLNPRDYTQSDLPNGMSPLRLSGPKSQAFFLYAHAKATAQQPDGTILDQLVAQEELAMAETSINLANIPDSMLSGQLPPPEVPYHPSIYTHVNRSRLRD
jgi:glycerol-3-phosphate O-acyltransferase